VIGHWETNAIQSENRGAIALIQVKPADSFCGEAPVNDDARAILARCGFFRGLDQAQMERVTGMALRQSFAKDQVIFRQGDPPPGIYVVGSGRVRLFKLNPAGKEYVLHLADVGSTFAEVAAIGGFACPATAQALEPTACVLLPTAKFMAALRESHDLCLQLMGNMALWVRQFVGLMEDLVLRDAMGRVARFILDGSDEGNVMELPALKRHLASHLNLTSETLSRTLRRLGEAGVIEEVDAKRIKVLDRAALRELAVVA
jgi:CRP/FNR family transcriptional regulator